MMENCWGNLRWQLLGCPTRSTNTCFGCAGVALHLPLIGSWVSLTPRGDAIAITPVLYHQLAARWATVEPRSCSRMLFLLGALRSDSELPAGSTGRKASQGFSRCSHAIWGMMVDYHNFADSAIHDWAAYMQGRINSFFCFVFLPPESERKFCVFFAGERWRINGCFKDPPQVRRSRSGQMSWSLWYIYRI